MTAAWTPPNDPNPSEILNSTFEDKRQERYTEALAKHLWYHVNANQSDRSQSAVRLSFALGYWMDLAAVYPPAKEAFLKARDETESRFRHQPDFESFHELAAFNRYLQQERRTVDLFLNVAAKDHETAKKLYHVAEAYLIAAGRFRECATFLEPESRIERESEMYELEKQFEESRPPIKYPVPKRARDRFMRSSLAGSQRAAR